MHRVLGYTGIIIFSFISFCVCSIGCSKQSESKEETTSIFPANGPSKIGIRWDIMRCTVENTDFCLELKFKLEKVIDDHSKDYDALIALGKLHNIAYNNHIELDEDEDRASSLKRARDLFQIAIRAEPDKTEAYRELAGSYFRIDENNLDMAIPLYLKILKMTPEDTVSQMALCEAYLQGTQLKKAEECLIQAYKLGKKTGDGYTWRRAMEQRGRLLMNEGELEKAEEIFKEATSGLEDFNEKNIVFGCPYEALGQLYHKLGKFDKMIEQYKKAADNEPQNAIMQEKSAMALYKTGYSKEALHYINRAIARRPSPYSHVLKGFIFISLKEHTKAKDEFEAAQAPQAAKHAGLGDVGDPEASANIGLGHLCIARKNYDKALSFLKPIFEIEKELLLFSPGHAFDNSRNIPYKWLIGFASLGMGWIDANQGRHEKALVYFDAILNHRPNMMLALLAKANTLVNLKRLDEAKEIYEHILTIDPNNKYAHAELGIVALNKDNFAQAEKYFKKSLELDSEGYTCPYEGLGLMYYRRGKVEKAKTNLEKAIEINPNIEFKKYNALARIYLKEGKIGKARELLEKSIENYPHQSEAKELLSKIGVDETQMTP